MNVQHLEIRTPLGKGKVVHTFPDGTYAVEYEFGGGEIRLPNDPEVYFVERLQRITSVREYVGEMVA